MDILITTKDGIFENFEPLFGYSNDKPKPEESEGKVLHYPKHNS